MHIKTALSTSTLIFSVSLSAAFAQQVAELKDDNAKYTMQLGGGVDWSTDVDLTGLQSTMVATSPEGSEPYTMVSSDDVPARERYGHAWRRA